MRNGKYLSEFEIATIHAHQGPVTAQQWLFEDQTPDFLIDLAHQAIDNGADMVFSDGISSELATLAGSVGAGYTATLTIGVPT